MSDDQRAALRALEAALRDVLRLGLADLPAAAQERVAQHLQYGGRIWFGMRLAPLEVTCDLVSAAGEVVNIFTVHVDSTDGQLH